MVAAAGRRADAVGMRLTSSRRRSVAFLLVVALVLESVAVMGVAASSALGPAAADSAPTAPSGPSDARLGPALAAGAAAARSGVEVLERSRVRLRAVADDPGDGRVVAVVVPTPTPAPTPAPAAPAATPKPKPQAAAAPAAPRYVGRNHVWIPAFGINKPVYGFPCSRSKPPGNVVYKWGCAGRNNVYLFGHAANVFKGLHKAYVTKTLKVGQRAYYADHTGKVRMYAVKWWKLTEPTPDAAWAWASLERPSMTLQTCVGRNNEYRLMVRLELVKG